jgi:hypothetical protein
MGDGAQATGIGTTPAGDSRKAGSMMIFREALITLILYSSFIQVNSSEVAVPFWFLFYHS